VGRAGEAVGGEVVCQEDSVGLVIWLVVIDKVSVITLLSPHVLELIVKETATQTQPYPPSGGLSCPTRSVLSSEGSSTRLVFPPDFGSSPCSWSICNSLCVWSCNPSFGQPLEIGMRISQT
jgi:hypothetical protein